MCAPCQTSTHSIKALVCGHSWRFCAEQSSGKDPSSAYIVMAESRRQSEGLCWNFNWSLTQIWCLSVMCVSPSVADRLSLPWTKEKRRWGLFPACVLIHSQTARRKLYSNYLFFFFLTSQLHMLKKAIVRKRFRRQKIWRCTNRRCQSLCCSVYALTR